MLRSSNASSLRQGDLGEIDRQSHRICGHGHGLLAGSGIDQMGHHAIERSVRVAIFAMIVDQPRQPLFNQGGGFRYVGDPFIQLAAAPFDPP
jgi:hypothetical protein